MAEAAKADSFESLFERYGPQYRWLVTITVMLGTIATVLTSTIVNVAIPDIMGAFGIGQDKAQLLSTGFLAAMTGTMLLNAWAVESYGLRATFMLSMVVFIVASLMGGFAPSTTFLVLSRILQGASAGILQPLAMVVIFQVFPADRRGSAMGVYGVGVVLAPALGPAIGGLMVDHFNWRYVFFLAVPFCVAGLVLAMLFVPGRDATTGPVRKFDWTGLSLMSVFLVTLFYGLSNGQHYEWDSDRILVVLFIALVTGLGFIVWELHTTAPMLNLTLFKHRAYTGAAFVGFIYGAGIYGSTYLVPLFVQTIQGYTPTRAGLLLMPAGLILALVFPLAGRITDRVPHYAPVLFGLAVFAGSSLLMTAADIDTSFWHFAGWLMLGRIGLGFIMPGLNAGALKALPMTLLSQGSGGINFVRQLGGALGVNLLAVFLEFRSQLYVHAFTDAQHAGNVMTAELLRTVSALLAQSGVEESVRAMGAANYLGRIIYVHGNMLGYRDSFYLVAGIFLLALLPTLLMRHPPNTKPIADPNH